MAGIRRAPAPQAKAKPKPAIPLHQQILGKGAVEFDTVEDLRHKLELWYASDAIEYDDYLKCHDALDIREARAKEALDKATGRYVKPDKKVDIKVKEVRQSPPNANASSFEWLQRIIFILGFYAIFKMIC